MKQKLLSMSFLVGMSIGLISCAITQPKSNTSPITQPNPIYSPSTPTQLFSPSIIPTQTVLSYITPITREAITGNSPPTIPVSSLWLAYNNPTIGLSIEYPDGWQYVEQSDQMAVFFYPPDADPQFPSNLIALFFIPGSPYNGQPLINTGSEIRPIIAAGLGGIQFEDSHYAIPTESYYIELSHRNGTLLIEATKGPMVNLVPQLEEMLKTLSLSGFVIASETSTPIPSPTQPTGPVLHLNYNSMCRVGPGDSYNDVTAFYKGAELPIVGKYYLWYLVSVNVPASKYKKCWIYINLNTVVGNSSLIPEIDDPSAVPLYP